MSAALDDLIDAIATADATLKDIADKRARLQGYKNTRQEYADLVVASKTELDALVQTSQAQLKDLAAKITLALP